jgi:DNA-binding CsgD family transcriptional regulator/PAS domain-containing protein
MDPELFGSLTSGIYDAVLDPALWPRFLELACAFVGGAASVIICHDTERNSVVHYHAWGADPSYKRLYVEAYVKLNPLVAARALLDVGEVKAAHDLIPHDELMQTRFYLDWMRPQGFVDSVFAVLDKTATSHTSFVVVRGERQGLADDRASRRMQLLVPHLRRGILVDNIMNLQKAGTAMLTDTLAGLAAGVLLVDADGRVVFANPSAQTMLDEGTVVRATEGMLVVVDPRAGRALREALTAAETGDRAANARCISMALTGPTGEHWLGHVLPLTQGARRKGTGYSAVAALFLRKTSLPMPSALEPVAKSYRLTATELRVLQGIIEIGAIPAVAGSLGMSEATAKTHLRHLFEKTGVRRQVDLVMLVAGHASPLTEWRHRK